MEKIKKAAHNVRCFFDFFHFVSEHRSLSGIQN
jgi:hypothetical protein